MYSPEFAAQVRKPYTGHSTTAKTSSQPTTDENLHKPFSPRLYHRAYSG